MEYPHLKSKSDFPDLPSVNVYKYDNDLDYKRYDYSQMDVCVCTVPWDMGEAHIGNRTIEGIGNVVDFGGKVQRDAWFNAIPNDKCFRWQTKYKELHRDMTLDVPLPFDMAARYNYVYVRYHLFANDDSPVMYETNNGVREWFYFIREVEFVAPNTTRLHILDDAWQTFVYDLDITGMILERGHAPMFATNAEKYLDNPLENNDGLLTEDVSFGDLSQVTDQEVMVLNGGQMWACIASTGAVNGWGVKYATGSPGWGTPAFYGGMQEGAPSYTVFAVAAEDLSSFLEAADESAPQFKQTIVGVFFIDRGWVDVTDSFQLFGYVVHFLQSKPDQWLTVIKLTKQMFGYDEKYADLAKLYTYPYSALEITDDSGATELVKIEDTMGAVQVHLAVSLVFPYINLSGVLTGIGSGKTKSIGFANATRHQFTFGGRWYDHLRSWDVPVFNVIQQNSIYYDFDTYFDRAQAVNDYTTAKDNAYASANTAQGNADRSADTAHGNALRSAKAAQDNAYDSADTAKSNADRSADVLTNNASAVTSANTAITTNSNSTATQDSLYTQQLRYSMLEYDNAYTRQTTNNSVEAANNSAAVGAASSVASGITSGMMSGASSGGLAGAAVGGLTGLVNGAISGATGMVQNTIAVNLTESQATAAINTNTRKSNSANDVQVNRTNLQNTTNAQNTITQNGAINASAANSSAAMKSNATASKETAKGNADRLYDRNKGAQPLNADDTQTTALRNNAATCTTAKANADRTANNAQARIDNGIKQAALRAPQVFGSVSNAQTATTRPMAMFADVVTQSKSAIASAGDEFLRYGYRYDKQWDFKGWNIGEHFTYWKLRDFWVKNLNIPDMYMDRLRFFLYGGVTIWRKPEDIGNVTIYENGI